MIYEISNISFKLIYQLYYLLLALKIFLNVKKKHDKVYDWIRIIFYLNNLR